MSVWLPLALSLVTLLCLLGVILLSRQQVKLAYERGVAQTSAALVGVVADELGHSAPVLDRMLVRVGELLHDG